MPVFIDDPKNGIDKLTEKGYAPTMQCGQLSWGGGFFQTHTKSDCTK